MFIFVFIFITLGGGSKKMLLQFMSKTVLSVFSSEGFILSGLTFRSLIHLEFIFCMVLGSVVTWFFFMRLSSIQFSQHHYFSPLCILASFVIV